MDDFNNNKMVNYSVDAKSLSSRFCFTPQYVQSWLRVMDEMGKSLRNYFPPKLGRE